MTVTQIAEAIYDKLYEPLITPSTVTDAAAQADMLAKLFRFEKVKQIKETLEKCQ